MFDNDNPKVIVDDDFLDLRNDHSRSHRIKPPSAQSTTRGSSSVNTKENAFPVKETFPGLKRLINSYNQKSSNTFCNRRTVKIDEQPVDCRFRRKIEKKTFRSRSESLLVEDEGSSKEKESHKKDASESLSSDISAQKPSHSNDNKEKVKFEQVAIEVNKNQDKYSRNAKDNECLRNPPVTFECNKTKHHKDNRNDSMNSDMGDAEKKRSKYQDSWKMTSNEPTNDEKVQNARKMTINSLRKQPWKKPEPEYSEALCSIPIFKKSWTIPSMPLMKRTFSWTRHNNILCSKIDRKTYEFDTDDTISDSEDKLSSYSTISRNNYMNLVFCLGCLCGIFLIGGILTASEIKADCFKPSETHEGMFGFFYNNISYTIQIIFQVCYQILSIPISTFSTREEPNTWNILDKILYYVHE